MRSLEIQNTLQTKRGFARGMSLVELVVVMAILGVVMLAVMSLYIPAHQSTVAQSQVSDIQGNLRVAINRMSLDLLTAGFLVGSEQPVFFESGTDEDPIDFTIRTRVVGDGFGRVKEDPTGTTLTLTDPDMVRHFTAANAKVRLFEPITATELVANTVYTVTGTNLATGTITLDSVPAGTGPETVVLRIRDAADPPMQTIRYRYDAPTQSLRRIVNGNTQILAREIDGVAFDYEKSSSGRVRKVTIDLEGKTDQLKNDAISGEKTRALTTSVTLRNVF